MLLGKAGLLIHSNIPNKTLLYPSHAEVNNTVTFDPPQDMQTRYVLLQVFHSEGIEKSLNNPDFFKAQFLLFIAQMRFTFY